MAGNSRPSPVLGVRVPQMAAGAMPFLNRRRPADVVRQLKMAAERHYAGHFEVTMTSLAQHHPTRRRTALHLRSMALGLLAGTALGGSAMAQANWTGTTSSSWFDMSNWDTNAVPTSADDVSIGTMSPNAAAVDGANANAGQVVVGMGAGAGSLSILNGGTLTSSGVAYLGRGSSNGTVTVAGAGSTWSNSADIVVGEFGDGWLTISDGGDVNATSAWVGLEAGAQGRVDIDGAGSALNLNGILSVGVVGAGSMSISGSGTATSSVGAIAGDGLVTVTGAGSAWHNGTDLLVGLGDSGTLAIVDGGAVDSESIVLGSLASGAGTVEVAGPGSTLTSVGSLIVGSDGAGRMVISDGGVVTSSTASVALNAGSSGTATITGAGSAWNATGFASVGNEGDGTLTLADGGTLSATWGVILAGVAGSTGTVNIGAGAGESAASAGVLNAPLMHFGGGAGGLTFNHAEADYAFATDISGHGLIQHLAGGTRLSGDAAAFTGITEVTGGDLSVNSTLGGTVNVLGGTLGGSGTLAGVLNVNSGGTLAPGNSVGTLDVAHANFDSGSIYEVELNGGGTVAGTNNDLLNATGAVSISGGTIHVTPENGVDNGATYSLGSIYRVLTAAGGVTGEFDALTDDYAFLDFTSSYDHDNVFLTSSLSTESFCLSDASANQCATAGGALSLGSGPLFDAILNLSNADALGALDQLSGEVHASTKSILIEDSRFVREAALSRLRTGLASVTAHAEGSGEHQIPPGLDVWSRGFGTWGNWRGDGNAATSERSIGGFLVGGDTWLTDDVRLGLMGGYSHSGFSIEDRSSSATAHTYTVGAYGGGTWYGVSLNGGAAYSLHTIDTSRSIGLPGFSDSLAASYSASTLQAYGELAYGIEAGPLRLEPFADLAHVNMWTGALGESGGTAALTSMGDLVSATFATLGLRAQTKTQFGEIEATLRGMAGWRHAFGATPSSTFSFASGSDAFSVTGLPSARDSLALELGIDLDVGGDAVLGVNYDGLFGAGLSDHSAKATFNVKF